MIVTIECWRPQRLHEILGYPYFKLVKIEDLNCPPPPSFNV